MTQFLFMGSARFRLKRSPRSFLFQLKLPAGGMKSYDR